MSSTSPAGGNSSDAFSQYQAIAEQQDNVRLFGNAVNRVIIKSTDKDPAEPRPSSTSWMDRLWSCLRVFSSKISGDFSKQNTVAKINFLSSIEAHFNNLNEGSGTTISEALKKTQVLVSLVIN